MAATDSGNSFRGQEKDRNTESTEDAENAEEGIRERREPRTNQAMAVNHGL